MRFYSIRFKKLFLFLVLQIFFCFSSLGQTTNYIQILEKLSKQDSTKKLFLKCDEAIQVAKKNNDLVLLIEAQKYKAKVFEKIGQHEEIIQIGFEILRIAELHENKNIEATGHDITAGGYFLIDEYIKCLNHFKAAEKILLLDSITNKKKITEIRINISTVYTKLPNKALADLDTALVYLNMNKKSSELGDLAIYFLNKSNIYIQLNKYAPSEKNLSNAFINLDSAIKYSQQTNNSLLIGKILTNKAKLYYVMKNYELALSTFLAAKKYSEKHKDFDALQMQLDYIRFIYELKNNIDSAYNYREDWVSIVDSINVYEKIKKAEELDIIYETEKKEQENLLLTKDNEKKQLGIYFSIGGLVLLLGVVFLIYRNGIQKTKTNKLLAHKNIIIEEQNKSITDSIKYAQRIQGAILPPNQMWFSIFPKSFVLYKPKDILSGDFYWTEETENWKFVAAADCTGHGVPGALMSIVNFNLLNKAVLEKNLTMPGEILDSVNQQLTLALHQTYKESTVKDGMDITLLSINKKTNEIYFSGANNPIYILGPNKDIEMKGDKFPVGAFVGEAIRSFTSHKLELETGDRVFLFSDGYADQFGGPKGKKLKYKQMKDTLIESLKFDYKDQKSHLEKTFESWRGNLEQVDDVLVVGLDLS